MTEIATNPPQRPRVTLEIIRAASAKLCTNNHWSAKQGAELAAAYRRHEDGYELAKRLESSFGWEIGVTEVEDLDCMSSAVDQLHRKACAAWVTENNIQPPHPIGTMTTRGEITGICDHEPATYLVRRPGDTDGRRLLLKFEEAHCGTAEA